MASVSYNTGFGYQNTYDQNGFLQQVNTNWGAPYYASETLFTSGNMNGRGQYTSYILGNGLTTTKTYDEGFPLNTSTPGVQNLTTNFNIQTGNLTSRWDYMKNLKEDFTYDNLNRLTSATVSTFGAGGGTTYPPFSVTYDQTGTITQGNIKAKTDVGNYTYAGFPRHAVKYVDNSPQQISKWTQDITYTPFRKTEKVTETDNQSTHNFEQIFTYDAGYQRVKSILKENGVTQQTRYYMDGYEYNVNGNEYVYYIPGGDGVCAIIQQCVNSTGPTKDVHYIYTDHLGSIVAATDENGTIEAEQNFDAWGRFRDPVAWHYGVTPHPTGIKAWLYRGYTGHEHMQEFSLINMNGRMYDPILGRMLSPDKYVQAPLFSQSYNRFSYAWNNPLSYTDPSGDIFWAAVAAAAIMGGAMNYAMNDAAGNVNSFGDGLKFFGIGALAGAASAYVGGLAAPAMGAATGFSAGLGTGLVAGAASGMILGGGNAALTGGNLFEGAVGGGVMGGVTSGITGGIIGGLDAMSYNGNFWAAGSTDPYAGLIACNDCGDFKSYHFPVVEIVSSRYNPFSCISWMWPSFSFSPQRSSQNGGYEFTSSQYSGLPGRESNLNSKAKKMFGIVNIDEMLFPNGGGAGAAKLHDIIERISNTGNAVDMVNQLDKMYTPETPKPARSIDTHSAFGNWYYHETIKNGADTPIIIPR
ncbi:MAG TPA: RHS repeat-associated core domain-containing protein [Flavipsychrobacter sp.]|nr:RHS repeat-associated core domain-containing protein [Flavipsychrobacter sp.]